MRPERLQVGGTRSNVPRDDNESAPVWSCDDGLANGALWIALELPNNATIRHYDIALRPIFGLRFSNLEMCHAFPLCFCSDAREVSNTTFLISFFLYSRIICMPTGIQEDDCESRMIERLEGIDLHTPVIRAKPVGRELRH